MCSGLDMSGQDSKKSAKIIRLLYQFCSYSYSRIYVNNLISILVTPLWTPTPKLTSTFHLSNRRHRRLRRLLSFQSNCRLFGAMRPWPGLLLLRPSSL